MCGIAGYITKKRHPFDIKKIKKMTDIISHRGPDAEGHWGDDRVTLGHRRLSIVDLDEKSNQPMLSIDKQYVIIYNGEIYNYVEIKQQLKREGVSFKTESDTEVIIEAYKKYKENCFNMFNGMWSIALYDLKNRKVIFCRDRFGIKPLYIVDNEDFFVFGSEIKAITAAFPEEIIYNKNQIYRYLSCTVNEDVDSETFYKNIKIFPSAHYMVYDLESNEMKWERYWKVDEAQFYEKWIKGRNPIKTFKKLFENAIEIRLRADVEVGACLSGGIDSSAIVGCVSKKFNKKMHTFSSIYTDKECNEEMYIRKVNERWGTIPHYIKPDDYEVDFTEYINNITYHHDQPTGGASLYSQYMVMKGVQGKVKVVLDGQGADELFAGYIPYYSYYIRDLINKKSFVAKCKAIKMLSIVNKQWPEVIGAVSTDTIVSLVGINNSFIFQNNSKINELKINRSTQLFTDDFMSDIDGDYNSRELKLSSELNTRLCNDVMTKSIPSLLHNEDGNSMAFSIEARVPFLDYRVVEFAIALDGKYKIHNEWTKWIIRKACKEYLPKEIAKRKNKMGFPAPFSRWLREGNNKEEIKDIIFSFGKRNIVLMETIKKYYDAHINKESDLNEILFRFYSMEIWMRQCEERLIGE